MPGQPEQERLTFDQAVNYARASGKAAFAAAPVFGDDAGAAEGARVFIIEADGHGRHRIRFVAGPFFSVALAANEVLADDDIPARVREMQFMRTSFSEDWLSDQIQVLIGRLVQAAAMVAPEMPNYLEMGAHAAPAEVVFPIGRIGRAASPRGNRDS